MKTVRLLLSLLLIPCHVAAQSSPYPEFHGPIPSASSLASAQWKLKDSIVGDLNGDKKPDMALVLEYTDSAGIPRDTNDLSPGMPRILLVLLRDSASSAYQIIAQNNTLILERDEGVGGMSDDPYPAITIEKGILKISYELLRNSLYYKFRFSVAGLCLIGATRNGVWDDDFDAWDVNFSTGQAKHTWSKIDRGPDHVQWKKMAPRKPVRIQDIHDLWEVEIFPKVFI